MKKKAVFMDRDGTINEDVGYPSSFSQIKIYPSSFAAVRKINQAGLLAVIVTNQSGIGRGLLSEEDLYHIHQKMSSSFRRHRAHFDGIYYCPHYLLSSIPHYRINCSCQKPKSGMALRAARDLKIDIRSSYLVGDKVEDILFGLNIRATPILVLTGFGQDSLIKLKKMKIEPAYVAETLLEATLWILKKERQENSAPD